jgi:hypothetical protein
MQTRNRTTANPRVRISTIGHSNHDIAAFLGLLQQSGVALVADVRSSPFSRRNPQFNQPDLERALHNAAFSYRYFGDTLGGRPLADSEYDEEGVVDYDRVRETPRFQSGARALLDCAQSHHVALMCAEADPLDCHRGLLIAPALARANCEVVHIRKDGSMESVDELDSRLRELTGIGAGIVDGLFAATLTQAEIAALRAEAYRARGRKIGYRRADPSTDDCDPSIGDG